MDSLIFMPDSIRTANVEEHNNSGKRTSKSAPQENNGKKDTETAEKEAEIEVEVANVERPIDLYKVIPLSTLLRNFSNC